MGVIGVLPTLPLYKQVYTCQPGISYDMDRFALA